MLITLSNKPIDKLYVKVFNLKGSLTRFYYKYHKKVYTCSICGLKEAPFLEPHTSLIYDYGWVKFNGGAYKGYICHRCLCHDRLEQDEVKQRNKILYKKLKAYKNK